MEEYTRFVREASEVVEDDGAGLQEVQKLAMGRANVFPEEVSRRKQTVSIHITLPSFITSTMY